MNDKNLTEDGDLREDRDLAENKELKENSPFQIEERAASAGVMASPDGALSFLFGIFALLVWYTSIHNPSTPELVTAGGIWLILSLGAGAASLLNMARGKLRGNINLLATLLLGFFPGVNALIAVAARTTGHSYSPMIVGWVYVIGAVFCLGMVVVRLDRPAYRSLGTLAVSLGMFLLGLGDVTGLQVLRTAGGWCCFVFALYIFYFGLSVMYLFMGSHLPQGPALQKKSKPIWTASALEQAQKQKKLQEKHVESQEISAFKEAASSQDMMQSNDHPQNQLSKKAASYEYELDEEWEKAPAAHLQSFSNPSMILSFISAVFGLLNFAGAVWSMGVDDELAMGIIRLLLGSLHFMAALIILLQGNFYGNITLIFAVCFALLSGGRKVLTVLESVVPVHSASGLYGILQLFAGLYVAMLMPAMKKIPLYTLISYCLSALGLICFGLSELLGQPWLSTAGGWMFLVFALLNVYKGISAMLPGLKQGPQVS